MWLCVLLSNTAQHWNVAILIGSQKVRVHEIGSGTANVVSTLAR